VSGPRVSHSTDLMFWYQRVALSGSDAWGGGYDGPRLIYVDLSLHVDGHGRGGGEERLRAAAGEVSG
jgi:hypothetical protein